MNYLPLEVSYSLTRESFFILGGPYSESGYCWGGQASKVGCYVFSRPLMVGPRTSMRFCWPVIFYSCTHVELLTTTMHQAAPSVLPQAVCLLGVLCFCMVAVGGHCQGSSSQRGRLFAQGHSRYQSSTCNQRWLRSQTAGSACLESQD